MLNLQFRSQMSDAKIVPNVFLGFKKSVRYVSFSQYFVLFLATLKILRLYFERLSLVIKLVGCLRGKRKPHLSKRSV